MAGWLMQPVQLHGSREFACEDFTPEECSFYVHHWHFWYEADHVFALPTIALFMCIIGIFIIGHLITRLLGYRKTRDLIIWRRTIAATRYLSYRGFHVGIFRWNSAPVGLLILAVIGTVFFFCMDLIPQPYYWSSEDYGHSPPLGTRSGWMALACMPFVLCVDATASKANWITLLTGVPHEKLQVFHRWISYAFFLLALMHTFPFIVYHIAWHDMVEQVNEENPLVYWTGIVAIIVQAWLTVASFSWFRNRSYEFFKIAHFVAVIVFVVIFFWHCDYALTSWDYFIATAAVYVPCFVYPWLRTCVEYGSGKAQISVEDNGFTRIMIPANFDWVPGQHCFLRFRNFGLHTLSSHPFTICSLPSVSPDEQSKLTFYIRHQGGFTAKLYNYALEQASATVPVLVDGPYGGIDPDKFYNSDRIVLIAGGSGAGWSLPFIEQFARCDQYQSGKDRITDIKDGEDQFTQKQRRSIHNSSRPLSMRVILATRDTATRVWFRKTVSHLLSHASPDIDVQVYLTGEAEQHADSPKVFSELAEAVSISSTESSTPQEDRKGALGHESSGVAGEELHGRPPLLRIVQEEASKAADEKQTLGVFVCGPDTMQNDVRNAVAGENLKIMKSARSHGVYLHMEHFSWA